MRSPVRRRPLAGSSPLHRVLVVSVVVLLGANTVTLTAGLADQPDRGVASAAVALASTTDGLTADLDPTYVIDVPVSTPVDPDVRLPVPEMPPADPYAPTPEVRHGQLEIPAIGLSQPFFEGVTLTAINRGPSHWPGTAMPGEIGNVVIAGHRTTYTRPFWSLDALTPGDELVFTMQDGDRYVYELVELEVVYPTDVHIVDQTAARTATLFACHPRGSARQRIVGHFRIKPDTVQVEVTDRPGLPLPLVDG